MHLLRVRSVVGGRLLPWRAVSQHMRPPTRLQLRSAASGTTAHWHWHARRAAGANLKAQRTRATVLTTSQHAEGGIPPETLVAVGIGDRLARNHEPLAARHSLMRGPVCGHVPPPGGLDRPRTRQHTCIPYPAPGHRPQGFPTPGVCAAWEHAILARFTRTERDSARRGLHQIIHAKNATPDTLFSTVPRLLL